MTWQFRARKKGLSAGFAEMTQTTEKHENDENPGCKVALQTAGEKARLDNHRSWTKPPKFELFGGFGESRAVWQCSQRSQAKVGIPRLKKTRMLNIAEM